MKSKIPYFRRFVIQNFPFIENDFDALTDYELLSKVVEYLNKVIKQTNINSEAVQQLQQYVEQYFDNLDVQEEINNKLDQMAEDGQLADIIAQYLQLAGVLAFNTVAEMQNATNITNGSTCKTLGKLNYLDGGGRFYKIRNITNDDVVDGVNIISITADTTNTLIAELIPDQIITWNKNLQKQTKFKPTVYASMCMYPTGAIYETETVKKHILAWKKMGCVGVIPLIDYDCNNSTTLTLYEDLDKVKELINYAIANGMVVNTIKFHTINTPSNVTVTLINNILAKAEEFLTSIHASEIGITRVTLFNEIRKAYGRSATAEVRSAVVDAINDLKGLGYEVGITTSNLELGVGEMIEYSENIANACDFFAFNYYQVFPFKKELTTNEDSLYAWDKSLDATFKYLSKYPSKKIIMSETGVLNNWLNMMNPSDYSLNQYPANGKTYPKYFYGLLENQTLNTNLAEVWLFYDEVLADYPENIDFFNYYLGGENA